MCRSLSITHIVEQCWACSGGEGRGKKERARLWCCNCAMFIRCRDFLLVDDWSYPLDAALTISMCRIQKMMVNSIIPRMFTGITWSTTSGCNDRSQRGLAYRLADEVSEIILHLQEPTPWYEDIDAWTLSQWQSLSTPTYNLYPQFRDDMLESYRHIDMLSLMCFTLRTDKIQFHPSR